MTAKSDQLDEIRILECFFCNNLIDNKDLKTNWMDEFYIECHKCGICTRTFKTKKGLITYWNRNKRAEKK